MIERHDRIKFEVFALSFVADDNTATRSRVEVAFERFIDVWLKSDREVAARILTAANVPELLRTRFVNTTIVLPNLQRTRRRAQQSRSWQSKPNSNENRANLRRFSMPIG